jgi:hypothetical protein
MRILFSCSFALSLLCPIVFVSRLRIVYCLVCFLTCCLSPYLHSYHALPASHHTLRRTAELFLQHAHHQIHHSAHCINSTQNMLLHHAQHANYIEMVLWSMWRSLKGLHAGEVLKRRVPQMITDMAPSKQYQQFS